MAMVSSNESNRKRRWRRWRAGSTLLLLLVIADYLAYPHLSRVGGRSFNTGEKSDDALRALPQHLKQRQIRYAYFHVRYVRKDGTLKFHYPEAARRLVDNLHRDVPSVKVIAWIYVGNSRGLGEVDLSNVNVRKKMVGEALWLVNECGFDGVQWDYEICQSGNPHFLSLMRETRSALPEGKLLSTAVPMCLPRPLWQWGWSDEYFEQVAATCDQMAVMCYDSGFFLPRSYVWLVRQQAIHVTQAAARGNPNCRVLLGVPTYGKGGASHHPYAENIHLALKGAREGLADPRANPSAFAGVAVFADYTTQPAEWQTYRELWLNERRSGE
jgi:hypothetical protein